MASSEQDRRDQYLRFVNFIREERVVWGLESEDGWATTTSNNDVYRSVILFWSHKTYARRMANDEWTDSVPKPIDLEKFVNRWLRGMKQDGYLVGVNWNSELMGQEVEPDVLARDLTS